MKVSTSADGESGVRFVYAASSLSKVGRVSHTAAGFSLKMYVLHHQLKSRASLSSRCTHDMIGMIQCQLARVRIAMGKQSDREEGLLGQGVRCMIFG